MIAGTIDHSDRATNKSLNPLQSRTTENQEARTPAHRRGKPDPKLFPLCDSSNLQPILQDSTNPHLSPNLSTS
nr:MAG TPA: hypothetical protein [Caudoviricetes sp.]